MSVEGGATGLAPRLLRAEKLTDLSSLGGEALGGVVEHLGDRPPPGPPGERYLFSRIRRTVLVAAAAHDLERIEVGAQLGRGTRWGEVVLARRSERFALGGRGIAACCRGPGRGRDDRGYRGWLMIWLISARSW